VKDSRIDRAPALALQVRGTESLRTMASEERDRAMQRLEAALAEQDRLGQRYGAAVGTSTEFGAYVRLRAAGDQVTARQAWLNWVDDEGYRGLNAGPYELLTEKPRSSLALEELKG
jgi:hypothetical protein